MYRNNRYRLLIACRLSSSWIVRHDSASTNHLPVRHHVTNIWKLVHQWNLKQIFNYYLSLQLDLL